MISLDDALERAKLSADDTGILSNYTYQMLVDQLSDSEKYEFTLSLIDLGIRTKLGSSVIVADLFKAISKKATPVSDYELSKEYGDLEDYESFEEEYEDELDYGGMTPEDFNHATIVLSLLGYDVSSMTPEEVAKVVARKPKLLELQPKYDISGSWVHTIRQTDMNKLAKTAKEMASIGKEICVTDANEAPFWDFSEYRRFALVFNGVCKVLWNADVYSESSEGQLSAVDKPINHLDEMTEGWLIPSECELVGILCKDLKEHEVDNFINVFKELGLDPNSDRTLQKTISSFELIEFEEAQEYFDIPYDSGEIDIFNIENPEDLYEVTDEGNIVQDQLNNSLISASSSGNIEGIILAIESGADIHANNDYALRRASDNGHVEVVKLLLENGADVHAENDRALRGASENGHVEIVKLLLENGADVHAYEDAALRWASSNGHVEVVKLLLENGADVHAENEEALREASEYGHVKIVNLLLENGANLSVLPKGKQKEYAKYVSKKKAQTFKQQPSGLWTPDTWEEETPESETLPSDSEQFYDWNKSEEPQEASLYDLYDLEKYKETLESAGIKIDRNGMVTFYQTNIPGVYSNQIPMKPIPMDKAVALLENNAKMVDNEQNRIKSLQDILSRLNSEFSGLDDSMQDVIANFDDVLAVLEQFKYSEKSTNQDIAAIAEGLKTLRTFLSDSGPELSDLAYGIDQHADVIRDTQGKLDWYYQSQYEKGSDKSSLVEAMDVMMDVQQNDPAAFENLVKDMGGIAASFKRSFFLQKMSKFKDTGRLVTEEDIRLVHSYGVKNPDDFFDMYTEVLSQALQLGRLGYELGPVGHCSRYGKIPDSGRSVNYRDQYAEKGVSVISFEEDESGSSGAKLFMSDRGVVEFDGILIEGAVGSDGENLVLPVNYYSLIDDLSGF